MSPKHVFNLTAAIMAFTIPNVAQAQVVVLVDANTGGCVYKYNRQDAYAAAANEARERWSNEGHKILASSRTGYGAVFGVKNPRTNMTEFFVEHGYSNSEDAIVNARARAATYVRDLGVFATSFICGNWNNRGDYPLDSYPTYGEN